MIFSNPYTLLSTEGHYFQKLLIIYNLDHLTTLCLVAQSCPTLCDPMDPGTSVQGDSLGKNTGVGRHGLLQVIFKPRSPALQVDSLPSETPGQQPPKQPNNKKISVSYSKNSIFQEMSLIQTPGHDPQIFPIPNSFNLRELQFLLLKNLDLNHHFPITT